MLRLSHTTDGNYNSSRLFFYITWVLSEEEIVVTCMFKLMIKSYSQLVSEQHTSVVCTVFLKLLWEKPRKAVAVFFLYIHIFIQIRLRIPFSCILIGRLPIINLTDLHKIISDFTEELLVLFFKYLHVKSKQKI